ncbi:hypothetical protein PoB_002801900 [Plakobranchus ocellatus]|uniref:Uncharacterized protein n=1 Tax=Plakobranchus ocellatus TaxID=259542 RepID=A0AAV4A5J9_9GAST|nr:hypothetical protein PoB_002801900 [Plakobranchus ocellatus]
MKFSSPDHVAEADLTQVLQGLGQDLDLDPDLDPHHHGDGGASGAAVTAEAHPLGHTALEMGEVETNLERTEEGDPRLQGDVAEVAKSLPKEKGISFHSQQEKRKTEEVDSFKSKATGIPEIKSKVGFWELQPDLQVNPTSK